MKTKYLLTLLAASSVLVAGCNSGSSSSSVNEKQSGQVTTSTAIIGYIANNCRVISPTGSCTVTLGYVSSTQAGSGQSIGLTLPSGYTMSPSSCPATTTTEQSCNVTITATSSANTKTAQSVNVTLNNAVILDSITGAPFGFYVGDSNN